MRGPMSLWVRFLKFNVVGVFGAAVQLVVVWMLANLVGMHYIAATVLAICVTVVHNFVWHWFWTWRDRAAAGSLARAFVRFAATNGGMSLLVNLGVMATIVPRLPIGPVVANAIAIGVCAVVNFWLGNEVVFSQ